MKRYNILEGDKTTSNGTVIATDRSFTDHGRALAMIGDPVYCASCKSTGKIIPHGPRWPSSIHGRQPALDQDLCACNCKPHPRLIHSRTDMWESMTTEEAIAQEHGQRNDVARPIRTESPAHAQTKSPPAEEKMTCSKRVYVYDSSTGKPLAHRSFIVDVDGQMQSGRTDNHGYAMIKTDGSKEFRLHVLFSSPKRSLKHG